MPKLSKNLIITLSVLVSLCLILSTGFYVFSQNYTPSLNPQVKPLVADSDHDVVVLNECDLAVRFKKNVFSQVFKTNTENSIDLNFKLINPTDPKNPKIGCGKLKEGDLYFGELKNININNISKDKNYIINIIGCKKVKTALNYLDIFPIDCEDGQFGNDTVFIFTKISKVLDHSIDKVYFIDFTGNDAGLLDKFQLQFNSLAPSTPTIKL